MWRKVGMVDDGKKNRMRCCNGEITQKLQMDGTFNDV